MAHRIQLSTRSPLTMWPGPHSMLLARVLDADTPKPTIRISTLKLNSPNDSADTGSDVDVESHDNTKRKPDVIDAQTGDHVQLGPWTFKVTNITTDGEAHAIAHLDAITPKPNTDS